MVEGHRSKGLLAMDSALNDRIVKGVKSFEDLRIWRESRELVNDIYQTFWNNDSKLKDFSFGNQIRRASISVMNNISEGFERDSDAEFARFLVISKGSCGEVRSMLYLAEDLNYISPEIGKKLRNKTSQLTREIYALIQYLKKST